MLLSRRELPILIVNLIYFPIFLVVSLTRNNYEFVLYAGVILLVGAWILWQQRTVKFGRTILWGLTVWGLLHMAGGNIQVGDGVLYGMGLISLIPEYNILRYDQLVHLLGFAVATLVCYHLLQPYLKSDSAPWGPLCLLILLMGSGLGAMNEIVEFIAVETVPETGVGGYRNTMLDLVFNLIGGFLAIGWITWRRKSLGVELPDKTTPPAKPAETPAHQSATLESRQASASPGSEN